MLDPSQRARFRSVASSPPPSLSAEAAARAVRAGDAGALRDLAALWLHAAVAAPERVAELYDASALGWTGRAPAGPEISAPPSPPAPTPDAFWDAFWALMDDTAPGDALGVTQSTAALSAHLDPSMTARVAEAALAWPEVASAAAGGEPERFTMEALAACPPGSLGATFHALIVDNGFDLEVLDREALNLAALPRPLDYLNARILQCHDLWHLAGGYRTTGLHEVAISGFQAGQFGHHYSTLFLARVLTRIAGERPEGAAMFLDVILSAWTHGRETPPLIGVDWPSVWSLPVPAVRERLGMTAYASPYPADLFEQLRAA